MIGDTLSPCSYCALLHHGECPRVSAREHFPDGTLRRVEFHSERDRYVPLGTTRVMTETGWVGLAEYLATLWR